MASWGAPRMALWSRRDPVTLFGAVRSVRGCPEMQAHRRGSRGRARRAAGRARVDLRCGRGAALSPWPARRGRPVRALGLDLAPRMVEGTAQEPGDLLTVEVCGADVSALGLPSAAHDVVSAGRPAHVRPTPSTGAGSRTSEEQLRSPLAASLRDASAGRSRTSRLIPISRGCPVTAHRRGAEVPDRSSGGSVHAQRSHD